MNGKASPPTPVKAEPSPKNLLAETEPETVKTPFGISTFPLEDTFNNDIPEILFTSNKLPSKTI